MKLTAENLLRTPEGQAAYVAWRNDPMTKLVTEVIEGEAEPILPPIAMMSEGGIGTALHANQCGIRWVLRRMVALDERHATEDVESEFPSLDKFDAYDRAKKTLGRM